VCSDVPSVVQVFAKKLMQDQADAQAAAKGKKVA
jgi:hypothetical protein